MRPGKQAIQLVAAGFVVTLLPALGFPKAWPATLVLWIGLALVMSADAILSPSRATLDCRLSAPETISMGEEGKASLSISLGARRPLPAEIALDLSELLMAVPPIRARLGTRPADLRFPLDASRRGEAGIERVWIRYTSPLGLWRWTRVFPLETKVRVLPSLTLVHRAALRFFNEREFRTGLKIERYRGDGTEFDSLKEFLVGEDSRAIDWKASARHRKLMGRQFRAERNHQIVVAVDTGHLMAEPIGGMPRLDHALAAGLLLAWVCLTNGDRVGIFTFDARIGPGIQPVGGVGSMKLLTRMTSAVRYSPEETNFTLGLMTLAQRVHRRSLIVLLTDFVDTVTAELMMENIARIGKRHLVVFVSIRDPLLGRLAAEPPSGVDALGRALVAQRLMRNRAIVLRKLARMGVQALDLEPDRIGPEMINRYLDIKRRERV